MAQATTSAQSNGNQVNNDRLKKFHSLFADKNRNNNNGKCDKTGLSLSRSFNYSLQTCLYIEDTCWVLAMLDVDSLSSINTELGYPGANFTIDQIGKIIKNFCDNMPSKFKGFRCNDNGKGDLFGILLHCSPKLEIAERLMNRLLKQIEKLTKRTVSIGIAKMITSESFEQWKHRALKNIEIVKKNKKNPSGNTNNGSNGIYSDLSVIFNNNTDEKTNENNSNLHKSTRKLGNKNDFDNKMKEIARSRNDDGNWVAAIMDVDDMGSFLFANNNNRDVAKREIEKIGMEMIDLFDMLGGGDDNVDNDEMYFGYNLSNGDEFGMILRDNHILPAHEIIHILMCNIKDNTQVTVSIGFSKLMQGTMEIADEWEERINTYLQHAKDNGKDQAYWGQTTKKTRSSLLLNQSQTALALSSAEDDAITMKSLAAIEKKAANGGSGGGGGDNDGSKDDKKDDGTHHNRNNVSIIVSNGDMTIKSSDYLNDIKECEVDPTKTIEFGGKISFQRIYKEILKFDFENCHLKIDKLWKKYENNTICNAGDCRYCRLKDKAQENRQCGDILFCDSKRRAMGNQLYRIARERKCITNALRSTVTQMVVNYEMMIDNSKEYQATQNWFINVYSYLTWQQEMIGDLLSNVAKFETKDNNSNNNNNNNNNNTFELIFGLLCVVHSYLEQASELVLLFYICFNWDFVCVFHALIEDAIGVLESTLLFCNNKRSNTQRVSSNNSNGFAILALNITKEAFEKEISVDETRIQSWNDEILQSMKVISILKELLYDVFNISEQKSENNNNTNTTDTENTEMKRNENNDNIINVNQSNPLDFVSMVKFKFNEVISNIKTRILIENEMKINCSDEFNLMNELVTLMKDKDNDNENDKNDKEKKDDESDSIRGLDEDSTDNDDDDDDTRDVYMAKYKNIVLFEVADGDTFEVRREIAAMSGYLKMQPTFGDVLKHLNIHVKTITQSSLVMQLQIPKVLCNIIGIYSISFPKVSSVRGSIMKKILQYLSYHENNPAKEIAKPLISANMREVVSEWDANFMEVDQETLFEIIMGANYLDIPPLVDLACAKVASMIKGKTPEEIRKRFNIENDFSPEEEEAVRAENRWAEDS